MRPRQAHLILVQLPLQAVVRLQVDHVKEISGHGHQAVQSQDSFPGALWVSFGTKVALNRDKEGLRER